MNHYCYQDIFVGQQEQFSVTVTRDMMERFYAITGDDNPLHTQEEYAKAKGYKGCVCYGMLTSSFLSTLAGVYLPGEKSLIHSVESKYVKPVFPGDTLTISGEVTEKNDLFHTITVKTQMRNQEGEKVLRGKMQIGLLEES